MVTLDPTKDYYGALEVSPAAGDEDIKRQYRKLALLYHPDRNPGKEIEYIPRFQMIQEAYEILTNPEQRGKYDIKRKRGATNAASPMPPPSRRGNPFQATSNFPPPPRRTGPQRTASGVPPTARNGAHMYEQWTAPPPPPRQRTSAGKEAEERKNVFNAWRNMNQPTRPQPGPHQQPQAQSFKYKVPPAYERVGQQRPVPTPPGMSDSASTPNRHRATSSQNPSPASAFEAVHGQVPSMHCAYTTRAPSKRAGFDPYSNESDADEPPTTGPASYRTASGLGSFAPATPSDPPRSSSPADGIDPFRTFKDLAGDDVPFAEGTPKEKTPYPPVDPSQRKEYFESSDLRRTSSVQDATSLFAEEQAQSEPRKSDTGLPDVTSPSPPAPPKPSFAFGAPSPTPPVTPATNVNSADPGLHVPRTHSPMQRSSSGSESSELSSESEGPMMSTKGQDNNSQGISGPSFDGDGRTESVPLNATSPPKSSMRPMMRADGTRKRRTPQVRFDQYARMKEPSYRSSNPDMRSPTRDRTEVSPTDSSRRPSSGSPPGPERSRSSPNLTKIASQATFSDDEVDEVPTQQTAPNSAGADPSSPPDPRIFRGDHWQNHFKSDNWATDWAKVGDGRMSPPKFRPDNRRPRVPGSRQTRSYDEKPARSQPVQSDDVEDGPMSHSGPTDLNDVDAMDVDTEPPADVRRPSIVVDDTDEPSQAPRPVYAEPTRPEWRDGLTNGDFNFNNSRRSSLPHFAPLNGLAHIPYPARPSTQTTNTDSDLNLGEFRSVRPFNTGVSNGEPPAGLESMKGDLTTGLPFTSQASSTHPVAYQNRQANGERLPDPPAPPAMTWSLDEAQCYNMFSYISQYHHFQANMLSRLGIVASKMAAFTTPASTSPVNPQSTRVKHLHQSLNARGILPYWVSARDETPNQRGFDSYLRLVKEDERLRKHMDVAAEKFRSMMEKHAETRKRVYPDPPLEGMTSLRSQRSS